MNLIKPVLEAATSEASRNGRVVRDVRNGEEFGSRNVTSGSDGHVRRCPILRTPFQLVASLLALARLSQVPFSNSALQSYPGRNLKVIYERKVMGFKRKTDEQFVVAGDLNGSEREEVLEKIKIVEGNKGKNQILLDSGEILNVDALIIGKE